MNVFSEVFYSCAGVKKYPEFLKNRMGKVFLYVALVALLFTVLSQVRTVPNTMDFVEETKEQLMEIPDFQFKNGRLQMDDMFYYEEDAYLVMADSESGSYINDYYTSEWYTTLAYYDTAIIMDETTILLKSDGEIEIYDYPTDFEFERDELYGMVDYIYIFVAIYIIFAYIFTLIGYFFTALLVALVGMIICSFMNRKLTFGQLYLLALYAKTLPYLLKGVLKLVDVEFFGYSVISFAVACVYLGMALRHMDVLEEEQKQVNGPIIF